MRQKQEHSALSRIVYAATQLRFPPPPVQVSLCVCVRAPGNSSVPTVKTAKSGGHYTYYTFILLTY